MDRLFEDSFARLPRLVATGVGEFPLDVYQTENELVVKAALPGVKPETRSGPRDCPVDISQSPAIVFTRWS